MLIDQIKPGMVFKENDKRFNRWVKIIRTTKKPGDQYDGTIEMSCSEKGPEGPWGRKTISKLPSRFHSSGTSKGYTLVHSGWARVDYDKPQDTYLVDLHFETAPPENQKITFACGRTELRELRDRIDAALVSGFVKKYESRA